MDNDPLRCLKRESARSSQNQEASVSKENPTIIKIFRPVVRQKGGADTPLRDFWFRNKDNARTKAESECNALGRGAQANPSVEEHHAIEVNGEWYLLAQKDSIQVS